MIRIACALCLLSLSACGRLPESYPPPEQRLPVEGVNLGTDAMMVSMGTADADPFIVKDIYGFSGIAWRWTRQEPTVRVAVLSTDHIQFTADFALWRDAFQITGPVTISFLVNGKLLDKIRYTTPGDKHFAKAVPADWLAGSNEATVGLSTDKLYTAPKDGAKFGVILVRLGLKSA
ncbi:MAG TPA: hypothetical protein VME17_09555 [Bryobacteraceae bacterium]|nr:hypothetical protein [Bryobacteraceae bacterium]